MSWTAQDPKTRAGLPVSNETQEQYDAEKQRSLPTMRREAEEGAPGFAPIEFTKVKSPGIYDAQFGLKDPDLIFQFWPPGYADAARSGRPFPSFHPQFERSLKLAFGEVFGGRYMSSYEKDVGSWFVRAYGFAHNQFHRDMAIKACEKLHQLLGGKEG